MRRYGFLRCCVRGAAFVLNVVAPGTGRWPESCTLPVHGRSVGYWLSRADSRTAHSASRGTPSPGICVLAPWPVKVLGADGVRCAGIASEAEGYVSQASGDSSRITGPGLTMLDYLVCICVIDDLVVRDGSGQQQMMLQRQAYQRISPGRPDEGRGHARSAGLSGSASHLVQLVRSCLPVRAARVVEP